MSIHLRQSKQALRRGWCFGFMIAALVSGFALSSLPAVAAPHILTWRAFRDPLYGFTLSYPGTWTLTAEYNGSHISLLNPATRTTFSPIVTTVTQTPSQVTATMASGSIDMRSRAVAGVRGIDYVIPFTPSAHAAGTEALVGRYQTRDVVAARRNTASTTNVYTFQLLQPVDASGRLSSAVTADGVTFEAILSSVRLPASPAPAIGVAASPTSSSIQPLSGTPGCDTVCWADANWAYTQYDDTSQLYCPSANGAGYAGSYPNYYCVNSAGKKTKNNYAVQVPGPAYFQPLFQCAEFAARAIGQDHAIPGLKNGGVNGTSPGSPLTGSYSYDSFPMTYMGGSYSGDTRYHLDNVGNDGLTGLYEYLSNAGLIAYQGSDLAGAKPGDLVFFYDGSSFYHVEIVISRIKDGWSGSLGGWDTYLDGHNLARYHVLLSTLVANTSSIALVHLRQNYGQTGYPSLTGTWNGFTDGYGQPSDWQYTQSSTITVSATWQPSNISNDSNLPTDPCAVAVYVPAGNATANVAFGVALANGMHSTRMVDEAPIDGWALLYMWGELPSPPQSIDVSNNTGTPNQQLGIGQMAFMC
jgi:hypothetical protein